MLRSNTDRVCCAKFSRSGRPHWLCAPASRGRCRQGRQVHQCTCACNFTVFCNWIAFKNSHIEIMLDSTSFWNIYILYLKDGSIMDHRIQLGAICMFHCQCRGNEFFVGGRGWAMIFKFYCNWHFQTSDGWPNSGGTHGTDGGRYSTPHWYCAPACGEWGQQGRRGRCMFHAAMRALKIMYLHYNAHLSLVLMRMTNFRFDQQTLCNAQNYKYRKDWNSFYMIIFLKCAGRLDCVGSCARIR